MLKQSTETAEDVLFVPNDYYIRLLKELHGLSYRVKVGPAGKAYTTVRQELKNIERDMSSGDIIRNTKLAFKN